MAVYDNRGEMKNLQPHEACALRTNDANDVRPHGIAAKYPPLPPPWGEGYDCMDAGGRTMHGAIAEGEWVFVIPPQEYFLGIALLFLRART